MTLMNEIAALREEIDEKIRSRPEIADPSKPSTGADDRDEDKQNGVDALLAAVNAMVDELGHDVDRYPRLSAIATFGVGLALGVVLGRQLR